MEQIQILLQYNGQWDAEYNYHNFKVNGVQILQDCSYVNFVDEIKRHLGIETTNSVLVIKYRLKDGYEPICIYNDMCVRFYLDLRKSSVDVTQYPLCISVNNKSNCEVSANNEVVEKTLNEMGNPNIQGVVENITTSDDEDYESIPIESTHDISVVNNPLHEQIAVNQVYVDKATLVSAMKHCAIRENFQFMMDKSSSTRYSISCVDDDCGWSLRASSLNRSKLFKIRKFDNTHSCPEEGRLISQRHATTEIIGNLIKDRLTDPKTVYTPKDIMRDLKREHNVEVNYVKAWRSKGKALEILRGTPSESYSRIPSYLYMLMKTNPGSVTKLNTAPDNRFMYVFIALYASIIGWEHCRPIVVVDGGFLTATYGGTMLIACTQDASGSILPLAYAVVDSENDASWEWFFDSLMDTYGVRDEMCIVSDRHPSILRAGAVVFPEVPHCICVYHLWNNLKAKFRRSHKQLKGVFFTMARAYTVAEFTESMNEVEKIDKRIKDYLVNIGYYRWSRAYCHANRGEVMTSNIAESINSANKKSRELPIMSLLKNMAGIVRKWNNANRQVAMGTFTRLSKKFQDILAANLKASYKMTVTPSNEFIYDVSEGEKIHVVCLQDKTCTCKRFQMDEIPCAHATAVVKYNNMLLSDFCSAYYTRANFRKTYEVPVLPMQDDSSWEISIDVLDEVVLPPNVTARSGRRKTKRIKSPWESQPKKARITCAICGQ